MLKSAKVLSIVWAMVLLSASTPLRASSDTGEKCAKFMDRRTLTFETPTARELGKKFGYLQSYYRDESVLENDVLFDLNSEQLDQLIAEVEACNLGRELPRPKKQSPLGTLIFGSSDDPNDGKRAFPNGWLSEPLADLRKYKTLIALRDAGSEKIEKAEEDIDSLVRALQQLYAKLDKNNLPRGSWTSAEGELSDLEDRFEQIQSETIPEIAEKYSILIDKRELSLEGIHSAEYSFNAARNRMNALKQRFDDTQANTLKLQRIENSGSAYFEKQQLAQEYYSAPASFWECSIYLLRLPSRDYEMPKYERWLSTKAIFGTAKKVGAPKFEIVDGFGNDLVGLGIKRQGNPEEVFVFQQDDKECFLVGYGTKTQAQWINDGFDQLVVETRFQSYAEKLWSH